MSVVVDVRGDETVVTVNGRAFEAPTSAVSFRDGVVVVQLPVDRLDVLAGVPALTVHCWHEPTPSQLRLAIESLPDVMITRALVAAQVGASASDSWATIIQRAIGQLLAEPDGRA